MPRHTLRPLLKIGSAAAVLAAVTLYLWWSMRIPAPREQDRVTHRDGAFSIIKPHDWELAFDYAPVDRRYVDTMEARVHSTRPREIRIFIGRLRDKPELEKIRDKLLDTQFQGQPAWVYEGRTRLEHYWRALFERNGQWYELVLWTPLPEDVPRSGWWPYLQSFRAGGRATTPTTA